MLKIQQLQSQGYVLDINDLHVLNQLSVQELQYVHEFYEVLDAQILKLKQDQEVKLQKTQRLRDIAFSVVRDQIKGVYRRKKSGDGGAAEAYQENIKVEVYGSMATGLAIDSSDLDILVSDFIDQTSPRFKGLTRQELIGEMQMIHQALNDIFALRTNTLIESASVPVIKLQINLVKLYERELQKEATTEKSFGLGLQEIIDDEELRVLNIDITLNEPKKVIEEIPGPG
jgi:predicted nucleotidyltransferase